MKKVTLPIYSQQGKELEKIELDAAVFDGQVNEGVLYQAILMYRANQRKGLASTKTRGEVSGGGRKPWRQKGTGRARVGSSRNPLWRKGGVVFGPHTEQVFGFSLPKRIKLAALKSSLNAKLNENKLLILDDLKIDSAKTKEAVKVLADLKLNNKSRSSAKGKDKSKKANDFKKSKKESTLLILADINPNLKRSFQNIAYLDMVKAANANAWDVLRVNRLIVTTSGIKALVNRIKNI
ncbi:MAG: 50S ribosomal protein L4 [Candidatus Omnitrophota bacterium]|jgi:large subunit ribosomal protein L4